MSKFDKNFESRTVANPPLQQSSFVFFPEEEEICKRMLQNPELFCRGAKDALAAQGKKLGQRRRFLRACLETSAKGVRQIAVFANDFAKTLPKSVFGVGNGEAYLLPLGILFEQMKDYENGLNKVIVKLDRLCQPDPFDPARFALLESVIPEANVKTRAEKAAGEAETIYREAMALSREIESFCQTVIEAFFSKAGDAADLEHDAANMRFGKLSALCAELENAAARFAGTWETRANDSKKSKGTAKP